MESYKALYYPFIHFKNDEWAKLAALYWDNLGRIVPEHYVTEDSPTVKGLGAFIETLRPQWVQFEFTKVFIDFVGQYAPLLKKKYALSLKNTWPKLKESERPPKPGGGSGNDPRLGYIYVEKMSPELYQALFASGLAAPDAPNFPWVGMHPRLAWVYMTALAEELSSERGLRPLTDDERDHVALSGLTTARLAQALLGDVALVNATKSATEIESTLVLLAFQAVIPKDLSQLSVEKVLEFREKYPEERAKFQKGVAELAGSRTWLQSISDRRVLKERLREEVQKEWSVKVTELDEKMHSLGIDTVLGCFNLSTALPATAVAALGVFTAVLNPIAAGTAALALGAIPVLRDKQKAAKEALKTSDVAYLYRMEHDLQPRDLWNRVKGHLRDFALNT